MNSNEFYVYVYIDPRNHKEFYYGKGKGYRKSTHLNDGVPSDKVKIIKEIKKENLKPIIKVIAKNLTEKQALLIESTLIWKFGDTLSNVAAGHYSKYFRPQNTLHKNLYGFDYENSVQVINVGEGGNRCWEDCKKYSFISAGQDWKKWGSKIDSLKVGDILCTYLSGEGYVGIARVLEEACSVSSFKFNGKSLKEFPLKEPNIFEKAGTPDGEFLVKVEWIVAKERNDGIAKTISFWRPRSMLASPENQQKTIKFLEESFSISFDKLLNESKNTSKSI